MADKKLTHTAKITTRMGKYTKPVRETKCYWIDSSGTKYSKQDGYAVGGEMWSVKRIEFSSIKQIED